MGRMKWWRSAALGLAALISCAATAKGNDVYYVLIWGSQSHPKLLKYTHTWATFVHAVGEGPNADNYQLEWHTISWLPATLDVRVFALRPEKGVNLDEHQTLQFVLGKGERVKLWGPLMVTPLIWQRSLEVRDIIASGRAEYRAISTTYDLLVADCIHAVAAVDPDFGREHYPLIRIGFSASRYLAREVVTRGPSKGINQADYDNSWLIPRLGLAGYPFEVIPGSAIRPLMFETSGNLD
jgi:hypothetical protein